MKTIIAAIHGIMTNQTDASWPDKFDAWMFERDPEVKVLKKEYRAGPFPHWNCWVRDPLLARSLANELELFLHPSRSHACPSTSWLAIAKRRRLNHQPSTPPLWLLAHSNGAVIALLTAKSLIARGHRIDGLILTGAACEADIDRNSVLEWQCRGMLGSAISYSSAEDQVLPGAVTTISRLCNPACESEAPPARRRPVVPPAGPKPLRRGECLLAGPKAIQGGEGPPAGPKPLRHGESPWSSLHSWLWGKCLWPYGCLGRTGWMLDGRPLHTDSPAWAPRPSALFTRWFSGGHSGCFAKATIARTFEQVYRDIKIAETPYLNL